MAARVFVEPPVSPPRDVVVWALMGLTMVPPLAEDREKREALAEDVPGELMEALDAEYTEARFRTPCAPYTLIGFCSQSSEVVVFNKYVFLRCRLARRRFREQNNGMTNVRQYPILA
jgi:hypothetical protein